MALAPGGTSSPGYSEGRVPLGGTHWDRDRDRENTPVAKICHTAVGIYNNSRTSPQGVRCSVRDW
jgi:hypothetical protein